MRTIIKSLVAFGVFCTFLALLAFMKVLFVQDKQTLGAAIVFTITALVVILIILALSVGGKLFADAWFALSDSFGVGQSRTDREPGYVDIHEFDDRAFEEITYEEDLHDEGEMLYDEDGYPIEFETHPPDGEGFIDDYDDPDDSGYYADDPDVVYT